MPKTPTTIKSICDATKHRLCGDSVQDFGTASVIREIQRAVDPEGTKELTPKQATAVKAFLKVLIAKS